MKPDDDEINALKEDLDNATTNQLEKQADYDEAVAEKSRDAADNPPPNDDKKDEDADTSLF